MYSQVIQFSLINILQCTASDHALDHHSRMTAEWKHLLSGKCVHNISGEAQNFCPMATCCCCFQFSTFHRLWESL